MRLLLFIIGIFSIISLWSSCKHDPIMIDDDMMPIDTTMNPVDTMTIDTTMCDTIAVSFSSFVKPTIEVHCQGCHSGSSPSGGIDLSDYDNIKNAALDNNRLYGSIAWLDGFENMPQDEDQLPDCAINKIKAWIDDGALNN